jgi:hypothetical protein
VTSQQSFQRDRQASSGVGVESAACCKEGLHLLEGLPRALGRPEYTTLTQLVGEYCWSTLKRRVKLRSCEEIAEWLSW